MAVETWSASLPEMSVRTRAASNVRVMICSSLQAANFNFGYWTSDSLGVTATRRALRRVGNSPRQRVGRSAAETPFAIIKSIMGMRQFLLRGLEKVETEWTWAATAFNLMKLVRAIGKLRADCATLAAQGIN